MMPTPSCAGPSWGHFSSMMLFRRTALAAACLVVSSEPLLAQSIAGTVRQDSTARPMAGVEVLLEGSERKTTTDAAGRFVLGSLARGSAVVLFRSVGYRPVRVSVQLVSADTVQVNAVMVREGTQQLDPVEVKAVPAAPRGLGREAFEERRKLGFGRFIDSAELRRSEMRRTSDLLRAIPGLRIVRFRECEGPNSTRCSPPEDRAASGRGGGTSMIPRQNQEYCWMSVLLDGVPVYQSGSSRPPPDFSRDFRPSELESIEVYRSSAEVPSEYGGASAACGVILLWSKRGKS